MLLVVAGCGAPAEPALRHVPVPENVPDLSVRQAGNDVILTFTVPKDTVWHEPSGTPAGGGDLSGLFQRPAAKPPAPSVLLTTIPGAMTAPYLQDGKMRYVDTLSTGDACAARRAARRLPGAHASVAEKIVWRLQPRVDSGLSAGRSDPRFGGDADQASGSAAVDPVQKAWRGEALPGVGAYRVYRSLQCRKIVPSSG